MQHFITPNSTIKAKYIDKSFEFDNMFSKDVK